MCSQPPPGGRLVRLRSVHREVARDRQQKVNGWSAHTSRRQESQARGSVVDEKTLDEARQFDLQGLPLYDLKDLRCGVPERCPYHRICQETVSPSEFKVTTSQSKRYGSE